MKKQKLLVCMLSTSLLVPSFPLSDVQAETTDNVTTAPQSDASSSDRDTHTKQDKEKKENKQPTSEQNETSKEKSPDSENQEDVDSESESNTPSKGSSEVPEDNTTQNEGDSDYDAHTLDFFKTSPKQSSPNRFESFLSRLFPSYQNDAKTTETHHDNTDSEQTLDNQYETFYQDQHQTQAPTNSDDQTKPSHEPTTPEDPETDTESESHHTMPESSQTDQDTFDKLDEASNQVTDHNKADTEQATEDDASEQQTTDTKPTEDDANHEDTSEHQATSDSTQTESKTEEADTSSKADDRVLESILDRYSEDAKQSKADYDTQKQADTTTNQSSEATPKQDSKQEETKADTSNPQLPSTAQLEDKKKPAQSFEDGLKRSDVRTTATFELLPNHADDGQPSGDITVTENKATRDFIKTIAKDAHDIGQDQDIYASVMIAQAILESDSGNSTLARSPHYNLFGIKGAYKGNSANFNTLEDSGSSMYQISAAFRSYPSEKESLEDYADLIKNGIDGNEAIYQPTWKSEAATYRDATSHLSHTYATDTRYADKLNSLIKHYDLTRFDKKTMPDLSDYQPSDDNHEGDFKPFVQTTSSMPYPHGQCTWYVYNRMPQFDKTISGDLGDARNWNNRAERKGYHVSSKPKAHTAVVFEAGQQGADSIYGHVAFVEKVNNDGSIVISESNVQGLGVISYRTIDAEDASELSYIEGQNS